MERTELPVAVFDSGLGGISVLRALVRRMPGEDFLYFGDSANAPYGVRPAAEVRELTQSVIARLYARGIKAAVIACNTATSAAIGTLRAAFSDIPVIMAPQPATGDCPWTKGQQTLYGAPCPHFTGISGPILS